MKTKSKITVCVLAYNRKDDLENVIKSFLMQDYKNSELVIIDDHSPIDPTQLVHKWVKKYKRIKYLRNATNLGLSKNFNNAFKHCIGDFVVFLGDDDIFIDKKALSYYSDAFLDNEVGLVRSRQILFRDNKLYQATKIANKGRNQKYEKGREAFDRMFLETISLTGLGYRKSDILFAYLNKKDDTMYPQCEMAGKMFLSYDVVQINKHLVGVQSHLGQLNVLNYSIKGNKMNILEDMSIIYDRIAKYAKKDSRLIPPKEVYMKNLIRLLPVLLPYNAYKNGSVNTIQFINKMYHWDKGLAFQPIFLAAIILIALPKFILSRSLQFLSDRLVQKNISEVQVKKVNALLSQYSKV